MKGYDAFGKPRHGVNWSPLTPAALDFDNGDSEVIDITKRGFTGHEHIDAFELIHMNGRMYDFNSGRFLSVDPYIQGTTSQAINPYSYIQNNPLAGVDPTGYLIGGVMEPLGGSDMDIIIDAEMDKCDCSFREAHNNVTSDATVALVGVAIAVDQASDFLAPVKGLVKKGFKETFKAIKKAFTNGGEKAASKVDAKSSASDMKGSKVSDGCSFVAGTLVITELGLTEIQDLTVGDYLLARNEFTEEIESKRINFVFKDMHQEVIELGIENTDGSIEVITTTAEHPFMLSTGNWISVGDMVVGDLIETLGGSIAEIVSFDIIAEAQFAYNFEVNQFHTYAVGENGYWVHNKCKEETFVRRMSAEEAEATKAVGKNGGLAPKPGHERSPKWISQGKKGQKGLDNSSHEKTVEFTVKPGTTKKLEQMGVNIEDVNFKETALPNGVLTKTNEPGAMGIGKNVIKKFNESVIKVKEQ